MNNELNQLASGLLDRDESGNYSFSTAKGDSTEVTFVFSFVGDGKGYIRTDDIHVFVRDSDPESDTYNVYTELVEDFDFPTENSITLDTVIDAPIDGKSNILIRRIMPKAAPYADPSTDAIFRREVLNNSFLQSLYVVHEALDGFIGTTAEIVQELNSKLTLPSDETPLAELVTLPKYTDRVASVFVWDENAEIVAVDIQKFLDYVGGSTTVGGNGLTTQKVGDTQFILHIGEGEGLTVEEDKVRLSDSTIAALFSPIDGLLYAKRDNNWVIPESKDILYDSDNTLVPDANVRDALRAITELVIALTDGARAKGLWNASIDLPTGSPDLPSKLKRNGDYWIVSKDGAAELLDVDGVVLTDWKAGEKALWLDYDDGVTKVLVTGWVRVPIADSLPADNIVFDNTVHIAAFPNDLLPPTQVQDKLNFDTPLIAEAKETNDTQDTLIAAKVDKTAYDSSQSAQDILIAANTAKVSYGDGSLVAQHTAEIAAIEVVNSSQQTDIDALKAGGSGGGVYDYKLTATETGNQYYTSYGYTGGSGTLSVKGVLGLLGLMQTFASKTDSIGIKTELIMSDSVITNHKVKVTYATGTVILSVKAVTSYSSVVGAADSIAFHNYLKANLGVPVDITIELTR